MYKTQKGDFCMKKKTILSFAVALTLGLGVAVGLHANEAKGVEAAGTTVYCKNTQSWWKADGAAVGAYCWNSKNDSQKNANWPGVRMTAVSGETDLWTYTVPEAYDKIIFTRVNSSGTISDWGAKTADLTVPTDGKNMYEITSTSAVWGDPGVSGEWKTYPPEPDPTTHEYKYSLNGAAGVLMTEGSTNEVVSEVLSFKAGDKVTFTKDDAAYAVNPKDADAYTKVEKVGNELVFVQDYEGALYLNVSSAVLWAGELDRGYYLTGTFNEWNNYKHAIKASAHPEEEGTYVISDLKVKENDEVQFINFVANQKDPEWKGVDETKLTIGGGVFAEKSGNNIKFTADGTIDLYFNSTNGWYSVVDSTYVPDVPEEDGYYLVGSKTEFFFEGATKMEAAENEGDVAQLIGYEAEDGEKIKVRGYFRNDVEPNKWSNYQGEERDFGGIDNDGNFVFNKDVKVNIYAKWVENALLFDVLEHTVPDVPAEEGYYIKGLGGWTYQTAVKMTNTSEGGNVAYYMNLSADIGDKIRVCSYYTDRTPFEQWANCGTVKEDYGEKDGDDFKFLAKGEYDIYAKYEEEVFTFYVAKHVDSYQISMTAVKYAGKVLEGTQAMENQTAYAGSEFPPIIPDMNGYVALGVYIDEACTKAYTPTVFEEDGALFVKYMKLGFYLTGDDTYSGEGHGWNVEYATMIGGDLQNKLVGTVVVPAGVSKENPMKVKPLEFVADAGEGKPGWAMATYEPGYEVAPDFVSIDENKNFVFNTPGTYAFYVNQENKVWFNGGLHAFLQRFINEVGATCKADGSTKKEELKALWSEMAAAYAKLSEAERKEVYDVGFDGGDEHSTDDIKQMIAKYAYIVTKYGTAEFEDFIWSQNVTPKATYNNVVEFSEENNSLMIMIVVISAATIAGASVLLILKKKRHSK